MESWLFLTFVTSTQMIGLHCDYNNNWYNNQPLLPGSTSVLTEHICDYNTTTLSISLRNSGLAMEAVSARPSNSE
eukprot:11029339-Ditylum_brightwellii.AAC.1